MPSRLGQLLVQLRQAERQLLRFFDQGVAVGAEHVREVVAGLTVDGDAERQQPGAACFQYRLAGVLNAITAFVEVQIIRLAIRHQQLDQVVPLISFNERQRIIVNNLIRKSLVSKIRHNNQIMVARNDQQTDT